MYQFQSKFYPCFLRPCFRFAAAHGVSVGQLLREAGLPADLPDNLYQPITADQEFRFYQALNKALPQSDLGLELGSFISLAELGPVGLLILSSNSLRTALESSARYFPHLGVNPNWHWHQNNNQLIHSLSAPPSLAPLNLFFIERALAMIVTHTRQLGPQELQPLSLDLDYPAPEHADRYDALFGCPIRFDQKHTAMAWPASFSDYRPITACRPVHKLLADLSDDLIDKITPQKNIAVQVKKYLKASREGIPSIEHVALNLGYSSRTLRRKLEKINTSFQVLVDEVRLDIALDSLQNSSLSIEQISQQCGYSNTQNFTRRFRSWTGLTPSQYRNQPSFDPSSANKKLLQSLQESLKHD